MALSVVASGRVQGLADKSSGVGNPGAYGFVGCSVIEFLESAFAVSDGGGNSALFEVVEVAGKVVEMGDVVIRRRDLLKCASEVAIVHARSQSKGWVVVVDVQELTRHETEGNRQGE